MAGEPNSASQAQAASLLWPILEPGSGSSYHLAEKTEFPDLSAKVQGSPAFPYDSGKETYRKAIKNCNLYFANSRFWKSFAWARSPYFLDKYFYRDSSWKMLLAMLDYMDRQSARLPEIIHVFVYENDVTAAQEKINDDLAKLNLEDTSIQVWEAPDYAHDRFALFDNQLWHCGASAAGSHPGMNAISGPWPDMGNKFRNFLNSLIRT